MGELNIEKQDIINKLVEYIKYHEGCDCSGITIRTSECDPGLIIIDRDYDNDKDCDINSDDNTSRRYTYTFNKDELCMINKVQQTVDKLVRRNEPDLNYNINSIEIDTDNNFARVVVETPNCVNTIMINPI